MWLFFDETLPNSFLLYSWFLFQTFWQGANRMPKQDWRAGSGQYLVWVPTLPTLPYPTPGLFWGVKKAWRVGLLPLTLELQTAGTFFPVATTFSSMPCDRFLVLSVLYCKRPWEREHTSSTSTQFMFKRFHNTWMINQSCSKDFTIHDQISP
jgi:hypothetical protein